MALRVVRYETTPNPNALKVWLDGPVSESPRSYLREEMAVGDDLAEALFRNAGATTILLFGEWFTFNKSPDDDWPAVKKKIETVVAAHDPGGNET